VIVDSSAVIAILLKETGWESLVDHLTAASRAAIAAPTLVETGIVLAARLGIPGKSVLARFVQEAELTVVPFTDQHWPVAVAAYLRFGKGRHPAALNFGDCFAYAVSQVAGEPLLCLGDDFARTDLPLVQSSVR
jgi:ribonuclease VapC